MKRLADGSTKNTKKRPSEGSTTQEGKKYKQNLEDSFWNDFNLPGIDMEIVESNNDRVMCVDPSAIEIDISDDEKDDVKMTAPNSEIDDDQKVYYIPLTKDRLTGHNIIVELKIAEIFKSIIPRTLEKPKPQLLGFDRYKRVDKFGFVENSLSDYIFRKYIIPPLSYYDLLSLSIVDKNHKDAITESISDLVSFDCHTLEDFNIFVKQVTNIVEKFGRKPALRALELCYINFTDQENCTETINTIAETFPKLEHFKFSFESDTIYDDDDDEIAIVNIDEASSAILSRLTKLKTLDFSEFDSVPDIDYSFLKHLVNLESLKIGSSNFNNSHLQLLSDHKKLKELYIHYSPIDGTGLQYISDLPLEEIRLSNIVLEHQPNLDEENNTCPIKYFFNHDERKKLISFDFSSHTDDELLKCMFSSSKLENLTYLNIGKGYSDQGLAYLSSLSKLERLDLSRNVDITGEGLKNLRTCQELKELDLSMCDKINSNALSNLTCFKKLEKLNIYSVTDGQINNDAVPHLIEITSLKKLILGGSGISDEFLTNLARHEKLEDISLMFCKNISNNGISNLNQLKTLKHLSIRDCPNITNGIIEYIQELSDLESLDIDTNIVLFDENELSNLQNFPKLKVLNLKGKGFTENGIMSLRGCPNLISLTVAEHKKSNSVSSALQKLKEDHLPKCKITHNWKEMPEVSYFPVTTQMDQVSQIDPTQDVQISI